jgi:hypothetical protein
MATVFATGVTFTMFVVVVVTFCIGVIVELTAHIGNNSLICTTLHTAEEFNTCLSQSILCSAADTATDKHINAMLFKKTRKSSVTTAVGINYFEGHNSVILNVINFEFFCVAKMLIHLTVFIGYCNCHKIISLLIF